MKVTRTFAETRAEYRGTVALVPTMGFFHEGHLALIEAARRQADTVVVSLFVNPLQFNDPADLARYPRDLDRDAALAEARGGDLLFAPPVEEMYPVPPAVRVSLPALSAELEGAHRPGHLDGVAVVVAKLYAGLRPDLAFFGRKDAQQLALVTRLAADLSFPLQVVGLPHPAGAGRPGPVEPQRVPRPRRTGPPPWPSPVACWPPPMPPRRGSARGRCSKAWWRRNWRRPAWRPSTWPWPTPPPPPGSPPSTGWPSWRWPSGWGRCA